MSRLFAAACLFCATSTLLGQSLKQPKPSGAFLALGDFCYTMEATRDGRSKPLGVTFQSIQRTRNNGVDTLAVVVHQHMSDGRFDMRDSFLLRFDDLRPIRLDSDRDGAPHVHLDYTDRHISGWKMVGAARQTIEQDLTEPVWDGNLWGVTFAALPLKAGWGLTLPVYQYDAGFGTFFINVLDQQEERSATVAIQVWRIKAGIQRSEQVEYEVSINPGLELAYRAATMSQHIGGDCSGLK